MAKGKATVKGRAIMIGLNKVDPAHYDGWSGPLVACEADASSMAQLAGAQGMTVESLLTPKATRDGVLKALKSAAKECASGDLLMLTYSGHGGQLPDLNDDEPDAYDETWCLFDGQLIDDELYTAFSSFKQGVRILVLSDSCHSGSVVKDALIREFLSQLPESKPKRYRNMPSGVAHRTYLKNRDFYDPILKDPALRTKREDLAASVLLISGCQDNQLSGDGAFNGVFTGQLLEVWNGGKFKGNYSELHKGILKQMPPDQTPNLFWGSNVNQAFLKNRPFTV
jgi:hypothetical protein